MPSTTDVFLSYSRLDRDQAEIVARRLQAAGLKVFWDEPIIAPDEHRERTTAALRAAKAAIVVWTPNSVGNRIVLDEALQAARMGKLVGLESDGLDSTRVPSGIGPHPRCKAASTTDLSRALAAFGLALGAAVVTDNPAAATDCTVSSAAVASSSATMPNAPAVAALPTILAISTPSAAGEPLPSSAPESASAPVPVPPGPARPVLRLRRKPRVSARRSAAMMALAAGALATAIVLLLFGDGLAR